MNKTRSIRFRPEVEEAVEKIAKKNRRSFSWQVHAAIENWLKRQGGKA